VIRRPVETMHDSEEQAARERSVRLLATQEHDEDGAVVGVHGDIDLGTAPKLREILRPVLERQTGPVIVDLSEVPFMDSTGVHVLAGAIRHLQAQNRRLVVVCPEGGQIHRLLAMVGLLDALTVSYSREAAVRRTRSAGSADDASHGLRADLSTAIH
jgi:anti-sigma B factor antagonist